MPGHQKCSCNKSRVWLCPSWPASQLHPFKVVTQWALGTTKCRRSSVSPLAIEHRYKAPWWTMKFCQLCRSSLPSLLEACSAQSAFKSAFFCAFSQFNTALNIGSFLGFGPTGNVHLYKCMACGNTYLLLQAAVTLNYGEVVNFSLMHWSQGDSVKDWFHHIWVQVSSNLA